MLQKSGGKSTYGPDGGFASASSLLNRSDRGGFSTLLSSDRVVIEDGALTIRRGARGAV